MTVSTITNVAPEIRRALENQNKAATPTGRDASAATLPTDTVQLSADVAFKPALLNLNEAIAESSAQNYVAAQSTLTDADFDVADATETAQARVQADAKASTLAQTNKLPPNLIQLLQE
jgi:hypothetical protein